MTRAYLLQVRLQNEKRVATLTQTNRQLSDKLTSKHGKEPQLVRKLGPNRRLQTRNHRAGLQARGGAAAGERVGGRQTTGTKA